MLLKDSYVLLKDRKVTDVGYFWHNLVTGDLLFLDNCTIENNRHRTKTNKTAIEMFYNRLFHRGPKYRNCKN